MTALDPSVIVTTPVPDARPIETHPGPWARFVTMALIGWRMMFFDKLKLLGTLAGVVFAVVLSNQQAGTFLGLMQKNIMFVANTEADVWVAPANTETFQPGKLMSNATLLQARALDEAAWAEPLLFSAATLALPGGGSQPVSLVGTLYPRYAGGPWNLVQGDVHALEQPDTVIFEDSDREFLGQLNLGTVRELNGRKVVAGGFTWGLIPFGPSYAFAEFDTARELLGVPSDQVHFVLLKARPGVTPEALKQALAARLPDVSLFTQAEFKRSIVRYILTKTAIGVTFGSSTLFGLIVGFVIVSLSMFSAVVDNVREFGTLKAIGATNFDLAKLLFVQSITYAAMGSILGLAAVTRIAEGIRSAKLALHLPPELFLGTTLLMMGLCVFASSLALLRLRKVEPAMVFR